MALFGTKTSLVGVRPGEFPKDCEWINSKPLTIQELARKVVLVDFWTYSCANCLRTLPHLKEWHDKYAKDGLVIVGVHTPEFAFEKKVTNVKRAVEDLGIQYPVVLDPDNKIWNLYTNHWWPRKLLVSKAGQIVYDHIGEGGYRETEVEIQQALAEGIRPPPPRFPKIEEEHAHRGGGGVCYVTTPELYLGHERGYVGNSKGFKRDARVFFQDTVPHKRHIPYLSGEWIITAEYLEHAHETQKPEDYLLLPFGALEVNLVMQSFNGEIIPLIVALDGKPLTRENKGTDITVRDGASIVEVSTPRMYQLVKNQEYLEAELKITVAKKGLQAFAFTFGGCVD